MSDRSVIAPSKFTQVIHVCRLKYFLRNSLAVVTLYTKQLNLYEREKLWCSSFVQHATLLVTRATPSFKQPP
jgi:hypothetical protein